MLIIVNKNKETNKFMPLLSMVDNKEKLKKAIKKQILSQIIEEPESIRAYKKLEVWKFAEINEEFEIIEKEKEKIFSYEEILIEIIENIVESQKEEKKENERP